MRILVLNGVNLDVLGRRDPELYGGVGLSELETKIYEWALRLECTARCRQTNDEGEFVDGVTRRTTGRTGDRELRRRVGQYEIRDALELFSAPVVEVHLSNIYEREEWRRFSVLEDVAAARFIGKGPDGYREALEFLMKGAT